MFVQFRTVLLILSKKKFNTWDFGVWWLCAAAGLPCRKAWESSQSTQAWPAPHGASQGTAHRAHPGLSPTGGFPSASPSLGAGPLCSGKQKKTIQVVVCSCHKDKTPLPWFPLQSQEVMSLCSCRYFAQQDLCPYRGLPGAVIIQNNGDKTSLTLQELLVCRQRQPRDAASHPGSPGRDAIPYRCHKHILKKQFMNMACVW